MLYATFYLRRTASVVGTVVRCLTLHAAQFGTALRTVCDETHRLSRRVTAALVNAYYLRDNLTAFLHVHPVALVQVE